MSTDGTVLRFESTSGPFYYYRQSDLIMFGNRFYCSGASLGITLRVLQTALAQTPVPVASIRFNESALKLFPKKYFLFIEFQIKLEVYISFHVYSNRYCIYDNEFEVFDSLTAPIKKIQKAMARSARPRVAARRLALAMSTHDRLGQSCKIHVLGLDLLRAVFKF